MKAGVDHLNHPGAGRQAAARPDRRPVGPRLDRRRHLHGHQEGRAPDDDGRVGGADLGHRDLAHRQLPARPRGEPCHGWTGHRRSAGRRACRSQAGAAARRLRAAADHGRPRRQGHARRAGPRQLPARRAGRPPLLRQRSERPALHPRQADRSVHDVSRFQRRRRPARAVREADLRAQLRHRAHQRRLRPRLRAQRRLLHDPHGRPDDRRARRAEVRRRARPRPGWLRDDAGGRRRRRAGARITAKP